MYPTAYVTPLTTTYFSSYALQGAVSNVGTGWCTWNVHVYNLTNNIQIIWQYNATCVGLYMPTSKSY
jgi:hypothetical protein